MRKVLVIIAMLVLVLSLCACTQSSSPSGNSSDDSETNTSSDSSKPYPNSNPDGSINLDTIAHFDNEYDYSQNPRCKIAYLANENGPLYQGAANAYEHWAPLFNCEWVGFLSANGDSDMFLTNLQNLIDQGVTGFILDPDTAVFPAIVDLISQYPDVKWMSQMAPPRDGESSDDLPIGGNLIGPHVGFDNFDAGRQQTYRLIEWKKENLPDVPWDEIAFAAMAFSAAPPLQERVIGAEEVWLAETGSTDNFFVADTVSTGINLQGGIDAIAPVISTNSEYKHWLVMGLIDDFAQAAAAVLDQQGLTEGSCVVVFGGSALLAQWDEGQHDAFRYALFTAQNLYAEPIMGAVYAYLNGWATPDTIWPSWVKWDDHGADGHTYANLRLPTVWLEPETYQHYLEWTDMYAQADAYPYSQEGISLDDFSPFIEVPADYKAP